MKKTNQKKTTPVKRNDEDVWNLHPIKNNPNIVRLPIFTEDDFDDEKSITFDKSKSTYSLTELKCSGLISGTCILNLDGDAYTINQTYPQCCEILFG